MSDPAVTELHCGYQQPHAPHEWRGFATDHYCYCHGTPESDWPLFKVQRGPIHIPPYTPKEQPMPEAEHTPTSWTLSGTMNITAEGAAMLFGSAIPEGEAMPEKYTPQVGDRVRLPVWADDEYATITWIGARWFLAEGDDGIEMPYLIANNWEKVVTYPEGWLNIYAEYRDSAWRRSREVADEKADPKATRIGVLHLYPDGHTEMEPA